MQNNQGRGGGYQPKPKANCFIIHATKKKWS